MEKAGKILPLRDRQENLPKALEEWLEDPSVTAGLGFKIAKELFMLGWGGRKELDMLAKGGVRRVEVRELMHGEGVE